MVSLIEKSILCTGSSPCGFCDYWLYLFVSVIDSGTFLPALSLLSGERLDKDERCFSKGKWNMPGPILETRSSTTLVLKPGISLRSSRAFSYLDNSFFYVQANHQPKSGLYPFGPSEGENVMLFHKIGAGLKQFFWTGRKITVVNRLYIVKSKNFTFTKHINKRSSSRSAFITYIFESLMLQSSTIRIIWFFSEAIC